MQSIRNMTIQDDLQDLETDLIAIRHHLHQNPELAFNEFGTTAYIKPMLKEWGYTLTEGIGGTGFVATLKYGNSNKVIGIRADMDALPITETSNHDWVSQTPGTMHACGHDGHTSMLLGAAHHLARTKNFDGTLHLIFQPAEEQAHNSGARKMIADGLFEKFAFDMVFAFHNHPGIPAGQFVMRTGAFMAACDQVNITLTGHGGHAARPHLSRDPLVAASALVMGLQTVVARNIDPLNSAVVSVGTLTSGNAVNVIPHSAEMAISVRSFSPEVRTLLKKRIMKMTENIAEAYDVIAEIAYKEGPPVLINHQAAIDLAGAVADELSDQHTVILDFPPMMGSEDFACMLEKCPGALIRIGNGDSLPLHNPGYDFNDNIILRGSTFWCRLVEKYLA